MRAGIVGWPLFPVAARCVRPVLGQDKDVEGRAGVFLVVVVVVLGGIGTVWIYNLLYNNVKNVKNTYTIQIYITK